MTIFFAIKSLSTKGGGAERVFAQVVNGLSKRGRDIQILTFDPPGSLSFYPINTSIARNELSLGGSTIKATINLRREILRLKPKLVVAFMPSSYVPISFALSGLGIPVIASEHNVPDRYRSSRAKWAMLNASALIAKQYTAVSEQMRALYPRWIRGKMVVMANPVTVSEGPLADVSGGLKRKCLLAVGRLHPQKDHITLIRAFSRIAQEFPDWDLRILGEGDERSKLEAERRRLGLVDRVQLPGAVADIGGEYTAAQLYVIPSLYESQGLATVEAMAHGLPAIGFGDCPGTNQIIIEGQNGMLVTPTPSRVEALGRTLSLLMGDEALRRAMAAKAAAQVLTPTLDEILDRWERLLESLT
jgi:glycosyltransferase involved in cell wall biosynthesis